jgi:6-phosphofructokinase 1
MVAHNGKYVDSVPLAEATGQLRTVPLDEGFVRATRSLGISMGD